MKGWAPSCKCKDDPMPCKVLDPFAGAGTTGLAALRHGRDAVLIELNSEYCKIMETTFGGRSHRHLRLDRRVAELSRSNLQPNCWHCRRHCLLIDFRCAWTVGTVQVDRHYAGVAKGRNRLPGCGPVPLPDVRSMGRCPGPAT